MFCQLLVLVIPIFMIVYLISSKAVHFRSRFAKNSVDPVFGTKFLPNFFESF